MNFLVGKKIESIVVIEGYLSVYFSDNIRIDVFNKFTFKLSSFLFEVKEITIDSVAHTILSTNGDSVEIFMDENSFNGPEAYLIYGPDLFLVERGDFDDVS